MGERRLRAALAACSNPLKREAEETVQESCARLRSAGIEAVESAYLYRQEGRICAPAAERARELMAFYRDEEIRAIFDLSGGDLANTVLPYLDFSLIGRSGKSFWGYSDLTAVHNAIYARSGAAGVLFQVRNLARNRQEDFAPCVVRVLAGESAPDPLFSVPCTLLRGEEMAGTLLGGNLRCLLKLAGTAYWPDFSGAVLLLESMSGGPERIMTGMTQLRQLGVFDRISGVLLGTFTQLDELLGREESLALLQSLLPRELPVAQTPSIGHGADARAVWIGRKVRISAGQEWLRYCLER